MSKEEQEEMLNAMSKIPGLGDLTISIEKIMRKTEVDAICTTLDVDLDIDLDVDLDYDFSVAPPAPRQAPKASGSHQSLGNTSRSTKITIRVPTEVVLAFKEEGNRKCVPYQRVMNNALKASLDRLNRTPA